MSDINFDFLDPAQQDYVLNSPAMEPPDGVVSNFDHPPNRNELATFFLAFCVALTSVVLIARIYIRFISIKKPFIGDYMLILGYGLLVTEFVLMLRLRDTPGFFVRQWDVRVRDLTTFIFNTYVWSLLYVANILLVKVAILLEWLRIFVPKGTRNLVFWACWALISSVTIFYLSLFVVVNISCTPYALHWNKLLRGSCDHVDSADANFAISIFNIISDVLILAVPQRTIWALQMPTRKKIGVSVIFAFGILACVAASARVAVSLMRAQSHDYTYTMSSVILCSTSELTCGYLVLCVPSLPKAFSSVDLPKLKRSLAPWSSRERLRVSDENEDVHWPNVTFSKPNINQRYTEEAASILPLAKPNHVYSSEHHRYDCLGCNGDATSGEIRLKSFEVCSPDVQEVPKCLHKHPE